MGRWGFLAGAAAVVVVILLWRVAVDPGGTADEPVPVEPSPPPPPESPRPANPEPERPAQPAATETKRDDRATFASPSQAPAAPEQPHDLVPIPPPEATGPIAELKRAFETEPRDSAAQEPGSRIASEFKKSDVPAGLLKSVLCRKSVCKVETLWTPERAVGFMGTFMRLSPEFGPNLAIDPHGPFDPQQELPIDVYLPRLGSGIQPPQP